MVQTFLAKVYEKIIRYRNKQFDKEQNLVKIGIPVISVGNLSVGGTGKTPFVQMLARELIRLEKKPAIIGRGYKRKSKGEVIVCDGTKVLVDAETGGDEMVLLAETLRVPVIAHDKKAEAAKTAELRFDVDCLIVDDGFQHRTLRRDLDIVLIDKETIENPHVLPKGHLREPLEFIKRADVICLTGNITDTGNLMELIKPQALVIRVRPFQEIPYILSTRKRLNEQELKQISKSIVAAAGIAKPERFQSMLKEKKFNVIDMMTFSDHHAYTRNDIDKIKDFCEKNNTRNIAITEKDAAKLSAYSGFFDIFGINCLVFPITLKITEGRDVFLSRLKIALK